ncbi:hypothetical protein AeRB84_000639 [Aphanomyces euteiches]|nr:hypothetical protein AeRB84_000639 [Aphanomyces euteiches]
MESILAVDSTSGPLLAFFQFLSVALLTVPTSLRSTVIPWTQHGVLGLLYFISNRTNTLAYTCGVSFPLLNLFRASTPMASLLTGALIFGKRYEAHQCIGVLLISIGIGISSMVDHPVAKLATFCTHNEGFFCSNPVVQSTLQAVGPWRIGIALLFLGLIVGSVLGHWQNAVMRRYAQPGKPHPAEESMFFLHVVSLGIMALGDGSAFKTSWTNWIGDSSIPVLLVVNVVANYLCIRAVYYLAAAVSTVSLQVILTVRKACSVIFSVLYFGQAFSTGQWLGSSLIFGGVLLYACYK